MGVKVEVQADARVREEIWQLWGLARAFQALGGDKAISALPGFVLAHALVEKEMAEHRAVLSGAIYRCAARAGHDIAKVASVHSSLKDGKPVLEIEMADLVDLADDARSQGEG